MGEKLAEKQQQSSVISFPAYWIARESEGITRRGTEQTEAGR